MILRITALAVLGVGMLGVMKASTIPVKQAGAKPDDKKEVKKLTAAEESKSRKALSELQPFVGVWKLEGSHTVAGKDGKVITERWKEDVSWGWNFEGGIPGLVVKFADPKDATKSKYFTSGLLRYDLGTKKYQLTLNPVEKGDALVFDGDIPPSGGLKVERKDAKGDVYRITLDTLADGVRFSLKYQKVQGGKGAASDVFAMIGNKDGESIAGGSKKPECIVSGGAANIAVNIDGKTYYVCCTGCRDELVANPKKYIK